MIRLQITAAIAALFVLAPALAFAQTNAIAACIVSEWYFVADAMVTDVPAQPGVLLIEAQFPQSFGTVPVDDALAVLTVTVTDSTMATIPGSLAWSEDANVLVWTADAQELLAGETYTVHIAAQNSALQGGCGPGVDSETTLTYTTVDRPAPIPTAFGSEDALLTESRRGIQACCRNTNDVCFVDPRDGFDSCQYCWTDSYQYTPQVTVTAANDLAPADAQYAFYEIYRVTTAGDELVTTVPGPQGVSSYPVSFDEATEPYCVRVDTVSLLDGSRVTGSELCRTDADMMPLPRDEPSPPDVDRCAAGADISSAADVSIGGDATSTGGGGGSEDGCCSQVRSESPTSPLLPTAAIALLGLVALRRRGA